MQSLLDEVDAAAQRNAFSGVVRLDRAGVTDFCVAYGLADRAHGVPNVVDTLFATASGTKGLTALVVMSLVEQEKLELATTARSLLGRDLPLIDGDVTVEHLLAHRSGIGDYLDEEAAGDINDYVLPVPVHELATTEQFLSVLDGHPMVSRPDARFAYNNSGYVVLALLAERATGVGFHQLVRTLVCEPAGMLNAAFIRSDELPAPAAVGYLSVDGLRTNVFHLPVLGNGDGGIYATAEDFSVFWASLFAGRIVSRGRVTEMVTARSDWPEANRRYGLGFHLDAAGDAVWLEGFDAGVSFFSRHEPSSSTTYTVLSNSSDGAGHIVKVLNHRLRD